MSDVQFDLGDKDYGASVTPENKTPAIVSFLVKHGLAKDDKTATFIIFGFVVASLIITLLVIF